MITTSPDGQWAVVRRGREVSLLEGGAGPATARIELPTADADLVIIGPPSVLVVVTRGEAEDGVRADRLVLHQPPYLDAVARLDLEVPMRIAAVTGPRLVLVSRDGKAVTIVRVAGRALSAQALEPGSPVEFAVGLERNQVLFGLPRKLESWDAVSGRPLLRMQLPLPPPPRTIGPAHGHVWATRPGSADIVVCRLSDGRPFQHHLGVPIDEVIGHPGSPLLILVTARGLVRLHCFAHSLTAIDAPWQPGMPLAQLVLGDDISLLGLPDDAEEPWRVPIGGAGAPAITLESSDLPREQPATAADKVRAMRERTTPEWIDAASKERPAPEAPPPIAPAAPGLPPVAPGPPPIAPGPPPVVPGPPPVVPGPPPGPAVLPAADPARARTWREVLGAFGADLVRGTGAEVPAVAADTELGQLADRLALPSTARRALIVLDSLHLLGEPALAIARLAQVLGDSAEALAEALAEAWIEALGQGELGTLAMLRRRGGKVALRSAVTDLLDGVSPRTIRVVGGAAPTPRSGATRLLRDGKSDAAIETELATSLGRIAVIEGGAALALLEARLLGATAVALAPPLVRPLPWPRDAGLIVVADPPAPAWVAALPSFTAA